MHSLLPFFLAMVVVIVLLNVLANQLRIAYPILLVLIGLAVSFIPGLPVVSIDPDMIFFIFLPPLLFEAAWTASYKEMKKWWRIITSFAFLVVFFTALSVAIAANLFIPGFSLALGFLLGGIVSPPDAVSVSAITKFVNIPKSTTAILEGESLLNDASSLIILRFALIAVGTGQFIWHDAALSFIWMVIGGGGIGLLIAWVFVQGNKRLPTDAPSDIALTLVGPYLMYWVAEELHCSGVLAVVSGGLYMSAKRLQFLTSSSRIKGLSVWESFIFLLNGIVFIIIGLELPEIVEGMRDNGMPLLTAIGYGIMVTVVLIVARILSSYAALIATLIFRPQVLPNTGSRKRKLMLPLLLGWTGMRGVVSLAAALSIPVMMDDGTAFPQRSLILFITFVAILLTLLIQGLTLPVLVSRTKVFEQQLHDEAEMHNKTAMKRGLKQHVFQFVKAKYEHEIEGSQGMQRFLQKWEDRSKSDDVWMSEKTKTIFLEVLEVQRQYLADLNQDPKIDEDMIRQQLFQIDLEEERLKGI